MMTCGDCEWWMRKKRSGKSKASREKTADFESMKTLEMLEKKRCLCGEYEAKPLFYSVELREYYTYRNLSIRTYRNHSIGWKTLFTLRCECDNCGGIIWKDSSEQSIKEYLTKIAGNPDYCKGNPVPTSEAGNFKCPECRKVKPVVETILTYRRRDWRARTKYYANKGDEEILVKLMCLNDGDLWEHPRLEEIQEYLSSIKPNIVWYTKK